MKICWFGIYDRNYSRNDILISGLRENGAEVVECQVDSKTRFRYWHLIKRLLKLENRYDYIYVAYPSPSAVPIAKLFSKRPVVVDAFYSMFDSAVIDRAHYGRWHPKAWKLWILDWLSILLGDVIITDTQEHAAYWRKWPLVSRLKKNIQTVYLGVNDKKIFPLPFSQATHERFTVHFHGTCIPLQGIGVIIEAIKIIKSKNYDIRFRLVGGGRDAMVKMGLPENLLNSGDVEAVGRVPYERLNQMLNQSDVVLGVFGKTEKTRRVIPNKVYEGLATQKLVITKDTPAVREAFDDTEIILVPGEPQDLARTIMDIHRDPASFDGIRLKGFNKINNEFTPQKIAASLLSALKKSQLR